MDWPSVLFSLSNRHSPECLRRFSIIFGSILQNIWQYSPKYLRTFPEIFGSIHQRVWLHFSEYSTTFSRMFGDIPWNVQQNSECLAIFPRMFEDIPQNFWRHSPEYNIPATPHVSHIPFHIPGFLVLYIALLSVTNFSDIALILKNLSISLHGDYFITSMKQSYEKLKLVKTMSVAKCSKNRFKKGWNFKKSFSNQFLNF